MFKMASGSLDNTILSVMGSDKMTHAATRDVLGQQYFDAVPSSQFQLVHLDGALAAIELLQPCAAQFQQSSAARTDDDLATFAVCPVVLEVKRKRHLS
jgi:hypothetical protein